MRRRAAAIAALGAMGALVACNGILGIEVFPDLDATAPSDGGSDAGEAAQGADVTQDAIVADHVALDAKVDAALDAPADARDAGTDALPDAPAGCTGGAAACAPSCRKTGDAGVDANAPSDGLTTCSFFSESCCTSLMVDGGTYARSYDGVRNLDAGSPATVSSFALDKYEVSVGRFRRFVGAWVGGWRPQSGDGIHTHLAGGLGVVDSSGSGVHEGGWRSAWNTVLPGDLPTWNTVLACDSAAVSSWTSAPDVNEQLPINCVDWYEAYAFCIWDGGFLPTETEWDYAAAGGGGIDGQRVYAWSAPPVAQAIDCSHANYQPCGGTPTGVDRVPNGPGKWGQMQLTGNVWEWTLDFYAGYVVPCIDCAFLANPATDGGSTRTIRGGSYQYPSDQLDVGNRVGDLDTVRYGNDGIRCARAAP
jgi:sulfatase modifying factor 1